LAALILIVSHHRPPPRQPAARPDAHATAIEQGGFREEMLGDLTQRRDELGETRVQLSEDGRGEIRTREQSLAELNQKPGTHRRAAHGGTDRAR